MDTPVTTTGTLSSTIMVTPVSTTGFSTTCCKDCMTGPFPDQKMIEDPSLWNGAPPGPCYMACPCGALEDASEALGFFEEGTSPMLFGSKPPGAPCPKGPACTATSYACCILGTAGGPQTPCIHCYIAKLRQKVLERAGVKPESLALAFFYSSAPGIAINQVSRELALRKMHPRLKSYIPNNGGAPSVQQMVR